MIPTLIATFNPLTKKRLRRELAADLAQGPAAAKLGPDVLALLHHSNQFLRRPGYHGQHALLNGAVSRIIQHQRHDLAGAMLLAIVKAVSQPETERAGLVAYRRLRGAYQVPPGFWDVMQRVSQQTGLPIFDLLSAVEASLC